MAKTHKSEPTIQVYEFCMYEELENCVDSMLFSSNTVIASGKFKANGKQVDIELMVRGDVRVEYDGVIYKDVTQFPPELVKHMTQYPCKWETKLLNGSEINIHDNNWFEYIYTVILCPGEEYSDGTMCEWDISKGTPNEILKEMKDIAKWAIA